jgi:hypothetical protein
MLNRVIDTSQFDPAWFDLQPDSFYGKNNNSCGFIPDLPSIVDEVDKSMPRATAETPGTSLSGLTTHILPQFSESVLRTKMSSLRAPVPADWKLWEPRIKERYKKVPLRILLREMEDMGLKVT